jgi:thioredoxin reductase
MSESSFDVVIIGGGPAGLSAALMLGRCRRRVVVCDEGRPRNAMSHAVHGFFTRDGENPRELLRTGRAQLSQYGVELISARVVDVRRDEESFGVELSSGQQLVGRMLLLATGMVDELPRVAGVPSLFGTSVFQCPYCDGWEFRDQPLAVYAPRADAVPFALAIKTWSSDLVLCTDGARSLSADERRQLDRHGIPVRSQPIARLEGNDGKLERIVFDDDSQLARSAMFFSTPCVTRSELAIRLGCELVDKDMVKADSRGLTTVAGLYVAGDASEDLNLVSIAVAEGTKAAVAIHKDLRSRELG